MCFSTHSLGYSHSHRHPSPSPIPSPKAYNTAPWKAPSKPTSRAPTTGTASATVKTQNPIRSCRPICSLIPTAKPTAHTYHNVNPQPKPQPHPQAFCTAHPRPYPQPHPGLWTGFCLLAANGAVAKGFWPGERGRVSPVSSLSPTALDTGYTLSLSPTALDTGYTARYRTSLCGNPSPLPYSTEHQVFKMIHHRLYGTPFPLPYGSGHRVSHTVPHPSPPPTALDTRCANRYPTRLY